MNANETKRQIGVAIVGLGGAVATTAVAGVALLRKNAIGFEGLPLATLPLELASMLVAYENLVFCGWDLNGASLFEAAAGHNVLTDRQLTAVHDELQKITPWPAVGSVRFCKNIEGLHMIAAPDHRSAIEIIRRNLRDFQTQNNLDGVVVVNLASTERSVDLNNPVYQTIDAFEMALESNSPEIGPAMLYAYAAIREGLPFANFTPSVAADIPALVRFAEQEDVPLCGKDGKTGQTMLKTALAPALRTRALHVDGWYSANILGNRDGKALEDKDSLASKLATKGSCLDQIVGYKVEDHLVDIRYYRPRGDNKESWDNIDVTGFLGQPMQIKVNFLCRDSVLAAPLVLELVRLLDCAKRYGFGGVQEQLGLFFKSPMMTEPSVVPEHALHVQEARLMAWLTAIHQRELASAPVAPSPKSWKI